MLPPTTQNIVVEGLLYVFFYLFYFLCKRIFIQKNNLLSVKNTNIDKQKRVFRIKLFWLV